jgi:beta-glucosidase/6-phospho-beta-glucosidase/beta-galactosidase
MPEGLANNINQKGIDYYNALIDEVVSNDLIPVVSSTFTFPLCYYHLQLFETQ